MINLNPVSSAHAADSGIVQGLDKLIPGGLENILFFGITVGAIIALLVIVYAGILYSISGDNSSKQKEAREWIFAAVKGLAVLIFGYLIINIANPMLKSVEEIDIEFIKIEELQPEPTGIIPVENVPSADRGFFSNKPIPGAGVSSAFGLRKLSDDVKCRLHSGIDFSATQGTPVYSTAKGKVIWASTQGGYGNLIKIEDEKGYVYYFAHLSAFNIKKGDQVDPGDLIGKVGSTGHSFGAHLHYEVRKNNVAVNINSALGAAYPTGNGEVYCANL